MLTIIVPSHEIYDEKNNTFSNTKEQILCLEHSLVSISKWESKYHKPFISDKPKTDEELIDYIKFMTITQNVDDKIYNCLTNENFKQVNAYIEDTMTATIITDRRDENKKSKSSNFVTSELIYYWMISYQIPFECQRWHLNRLLTLIKVCNVKNNTNDKMSKKDIYANNKALNAARRAKMHSKG